MLGAIILPPAFAIVRPTFALKTTNGTVQSLQRSISGPA